MYGSVVVSTAESRTRTWSTGHIGLRKPLKSEIGPKRNALVTANPCASNAGTLGPKEGGSITATHGCNFARSLIGMPPSNISARQPSVIDVSSGSVARFVAVALTKEGASGRNVGMVRATRRKEKSANRVAALTSAATGTNVS